MQIPVGRASATECEQSVWAAAYRITRSIQRHINQRNALLFTYNDFVCPRQIDPRCSPSDGVPMNLPYKFLIRCNTSYS